MRKYLFRPLLCLLLISTLCTPISAQKAFCHGGREEKYVALTFDDGPQPRYTVKILSVLAKYGIKATFFMIGANVANYPEVAKRVYGEGHEIGCHTYTHPHMKKIANEALATELTRCEELFARLAISRPLLFRPPEGFRSESQVDLIEKRGYKLVIWSLDPKDWTGVSAEKMVSTAMKQVQGGDILLFHDYISGQNNTITAIEQLIPQLLDSGYQFVTVSELMKKSGHASLASACSARVSK